ncbi:MAG: hypothetical protein WCT04_05265, partial [Planctomycetota bacterium]
MRFRPWNPIKGLSLCDGLLMLGWDSMEANMERCATGVVSQASEFSDNLNGTVGTSEARSAGRSRRDDFDEDPDVARWEEVKKVQTARMEWAKKLGMSEDDVQAFIDNKLDLEVLLGQSPQNRRNMAAYLKRSSGPMPRWMAISG